jgi:hypothetical protein
MGRWRSLLPLGLLAAALVAACGPYGNPLDTSDLTRVQMSSYQALPPPYGSAQGVLTSYAALAGFRKVVASDHIGLTTPATSNSGCTGGVQYTVVLEMSGGKPTTTLNAYNCGGQITGNITGDVPGFIAYVSTLLVAVPPEQG